MIKRSICIFPVFSHMESIQQIRQKYDPLAEHIPPHITLVFPFESDLSTSEVVEHVRSAASTFTAFPLRLQTIYGAAGGYLFLAVKRGNESIVELHDRLYTGILEQYVNRRYHYAPHLTVGRVEDEEKFREALKETECFQVSFETVVDTITVELIDGQENSHIECMVNLLKE